jgi:hypothetical protein
MRNRRQSGSLLLPYLTTEKTTENIFVKQNISSTKIKLTKISEEQSLNIFTSLKVARFGTPS